jgi:hypothetical protein
MPREPIRRPLGDVTVAPSSELERKLHIDEHNLEHECRNHPEIVYEVGKYLAWLVSMRDEAKQKLKEMEAAADAEIRHDAEVQGERITEKAVESHKLRHAGVLAAKDEVFKYERAVGAWGALKDAFQSRGYAIRDLIQLYIFNYYGSDMERSGRSISTHHADDARRAQAEGFRRNRIRET